MLHTVLRRRAGGETVEQIQPDLIIPTGKRKGHTRSLSSIYHALADHEKRTTYPEAITAAIEAGAGADELLPGLPMGDGRYNVDVPRLPILVRRTRDPGLREFRVTDLLLARLTRHSRPPCQPFSLMSIAGPVTYCIRHGVERHLDVANGAAPHLAPFHGCPAIVQHAVGDDQQRFLPPEPGLLREEAEPRRAIGTSDQVGRGLSHIGLTLTNLGTSVEERDLRPQTHDPIVPPPESDRDAAGRDHARTATARPWRGPATTAGTTTGTSFQLCDKRCR
ncbi:hypothetical protein ACIQ6K_38970 [Streptomyces sp. NPDC096354]|uniref:hypothetical protein n=1 Tax=Streptomyces sp. NPDC096354 TaxID=3366088 RepID=UPI00382454A3